MIYRCQWQSYECGEEFRTMSVRAMHGEQLIAAGWTIAVKPSTVHDWITETLKSVDSKRATLILCPKHRPAASRIARMPDKRT